jgi:alginate O-acetyltransferase complex protein AlgI
MIFSSILFLLYFLPAFLLLYALAPKKAKNPILLASSIFFYSWGAPKFIFVILGTTLLDFFLGCFFILNMSTFSLRILTRFFINWA